MPTRCYVTLQLPMGVIKQHPSLANDNLNRRFTYCPGINYNVRQLITHHLVIAQGGSLINVFWQSNETCCWCNSDNLLFIQLHNIVAVAPQVNSYWIISNIHVFIVMKIKEEKASDEFGSIQAFPAELHLW